MPHNLRNSQSPLTTEEGYFHLRDAELIDQMRTRAAAQEARQRLSQILRVNDEKVLNVVESLGFNYTTAVLLELVPMLDVAWSDSVVSRAERDFIVATAHDDGVALNTPPGQLLTAWLHQSPSTELLIGTLEVLKEVFELEPLSEGKVRRDRLLKRCAQVASPREAFCACPLG